MRKRNSVFLLCLSLIVTLTCAPAPAQTVDTAIIGTITDSSGAAIPGATVVSYTTVATVPTDNNNQYRAVFTNGIGSPATTTAATLTVNFAPIIGTNPVSQSVTVGQTASFTAAAESYGGQANGFCPRVAHSRKYSSSAR